MGAILDGGRFTTTASRLRSLLSPCLCVSVVIVLSEGCRRKPASQNTTRPQAATQRSVSADVVAANNRGVGLMGKFEYENARQAFEQASALDASNADVTVNLAIATLNRQREGDEDRALQLLAEARKIDAGNLRAVYCEGLLRLYLQSPDLAQPLFQKVVDGDPKDAFAAYYLGQCFAQQRQYDKALEQYRKARELDPHIRSAYYAASQAYRALNKDDEAGKMLAQFQELERNPRAHLAEFKYTRMGPKAMAQTIDVVGGVAAAVATRKPEGPIFLPPDPLLSNGDKFKWKAGNASDRAISITAVDIDHDGDIDIFIANCLDDGDLHNAVCINDGGGGFTLDPDHVLAKIPDVNAALWGDIDNDGYTDVYLCRKGPNMLWRQTEKGVWRDVTAPSQTANDELDSVDGALFDADGDGDLDIFVVNADGPNELFNNNLDGTFKPIAAQAGIAGNGKGSRQVLPVDLDGDRDLDIIVINNQPPHDVWINDRGWNYVPAEGFSRFRTFNMQAAVAGNVVVDGQTEIDTGYVQDGKTAHVSWRRLNTGEWEPVKHHDDPMPAPDDNGVFRNSIVAIADVGDKPGATFLEFGGFAGLCLVVLNATNGPSLVTINHGEKPMIDRPGPGRFPFASVAFIGRQVTSDNKQIRSNASGIGTHFAARIDSTWVAGDTLRNSSGPGQSLQPVAIGLGGHDRIDFLSVDWSDGVFQSEVDLEAGKHHVIRETQRQLSSCPVLFAWDGARYRFIADLLGVGGLGYLTAPNEYAPPRPWENLLLPADSVAPRDGQYTLKLGEPMEEACYLDAARLVAYDLPPGWDMTVDDRMNGGGTGPESTGAPIFYRKDSLRVPQSVMNDRGEDVTDALREVDLRAAPVGEVDDRFIGRLKTEQSLTMSFDIAPAESQRMLRRERRGGLALLIDGWIEYPYSQTMFAAWQAKASYQAPTLEMRDANGVWKTIYNQFGYPAGMPRQMALPLPDDLAVDDGRPLELRLRTNMEIYFDRIALVCAEDCPHARKTELPMTQATLADVGFPRRATGPQRQPSYDYDERAPLWDTRHQRGWYTAFGRVDELVAQQDDALAIFGPGEEIDMRFDAAVLPALQPGWTRRFVLEARGWCKDMDLYTRDGETVAPLPTAEPPRDQAKRDALHRRYNTRFESGR